MSPVRVHDSGRKEENREGRGSEGAYVDSGYESNINLAECKGLFSNNIKFTT